MCFLRAVKFRVKYTENAMKRMEYLVLTENVLFRNIKSSSQLT